MLLIIYTLLAIVAGNGILKIFYEMIQPHAALDVVFGWQRMLEGFYQKASAGSKWYKFLESALGGCQRCTSFWFMPLWFSLYCFTSKVAFHVWVTDTIHISNSIAYWLSCCIVNIFWYSLFHFLGAMSGFWLLTKKFSGK